LHDFIPRFDSGTWSKYNLATGTHPASLNYHLIHIQELRHYALLADDLRVAAYARLFAQYIVTSPGRSPDGPPILTWLSPLDEPARR
jgi:hypothetical protein